MHSWFKYVCYKSVLLQQILIGPSTFELGVFGANVSRPCMVACVETNSIQEEMQLGRHLPLEP